ncbi:rhomboid family intramembrane serine protease [Bacteriovorax sp. PP10]|uniref:Rhomboid family intramembrane serine protease n=1 Tax=Bacteriovorax antarcticus TaxID=3088717 RepID=A0ABU5VXX3_9BACT|nr:rhomboid family intramembrane serine protease [Bacteriovorax sp. PP10]MEA9357907.1 rhomboid family intramembrane serine protease [Bacteriovorax sp. PP10]
MIVVGELRDKKMIDLMRDELFAMGISAASHYDEKNDIYFLTVEDQADLARAQDYYRVKLGFRKPIEVDAEWIKIKTLPRGETTFAILIACVVLFGLSYLDMGKRLQDLLFMGSPETGFLYEILHGQLWRLITPIFIHLSILHILFNMLWFKDLGYLIEFKFGRKDLLTLIGISGVLSNLLQYCISGPQFGGMSGVLYAMLGYVWVYKKIHDEFDYALPARDITIMVGWLLLCLTGFLGPIANGAHAGGLFVGMLYAVYKAPEKWGRLHFKYFSLAFIFLAFTIGVEGLKLGGRYFILLWM